MFGVRLVAAFGVRDARKAPTDVFLVALRDAGGYLAQRVYGVGVEDKADFGAAFSQGAGDGFGDEDFAQVAGVDVAGDAYTTDDHVRAVSQLFGDFSVSPSRVRGFGSFGAPHQVGFSGGRPGLTGDLDVDDFVLRRAAGRGNNDFLSDAAFEDRAADRRGVGELAALRVGFVGPDDLEGPLFVFVD